MKKSLTTIPVIIVSLFIVSIQLPASASEKVLKSEKASKKTTLIDVRSAAEFKSGHLKNAINIPHTEIGEEIAKHVKKKDAKIVLYCKRGGRAEKALKTLEKLGYTQVTNAGGYEDLKKKEEEKEDK